MHCSSTTHLTESLRHANLSVIYGTQPSLYASLSPDVVVKLERAVEKAESEDEPVRHVLSLMLGRAEVYTKGSFVRARDSMDETMVWLKQFPVQNCTDVHVCASSIPVSDRPLTYSARFVALRSIPFSEDWPV